MDNNLFNHDVFNSWQKCKRRYYYKYVKKLSWPEKSDKYRIGKEVHALVDYYLRGFKLDNMLECSSDETLRHFEAIKNHTVLNNEVFITEWAFNVRIKNSYNWLIGRIDAIFYRPEDNKYLIVDWKTGQNVPKNPENSFQSKIYLYAFYRAHKDLGVDLKPENVLFQYIKTPNDPNIQPIVYSGDIEKLYENEFINIIESIENERIFPPADRCSLGVDCQFYSLCKKKQL